MKLLSSDYIESIAIAWRAIRGQALRTTLTVLIIAIGITALVGILTSIDALKSKLTQDFSRMGANTFSIAANSGFRGSSGGRRVESNPPIEYREAVALLREFGDSATISISIPVAFTATVKYGGKKTNPNVRVIAGSGDYLTTTGYDVEVGRNFSQNELTNGSNVMLIGQDIVDELFKGSEDAIGKNTLVNGRAYRVIGVLKSKGSSIGFSGDNQCIIPLFNGKLNYGTSGNSYNINIQVDDPNRLDRTESEVTSVFRSIRGDRPGDDSSFDIQKSDSLANFVIDQLSFISIIAIIVGIITLLGAAIGLMNIMLVSVTERTREIGVRKALGAKASTIRNQFLVESILIGQMGGLAGIILGIIIGNIIAFQVGIGFIVPWAWIILAVGLCIGVSIASGIYPAGKASKLDPIESLRYE